jgi:hypothetical protein
MNCDDYNPAPAGDEEFAEDAHLGRKSEETQASPCEERDRELEVAAALHVQATLNWHKATQALRVNCDEISLEHLRKASLSEECGVQVARLWDLFEACGLTGEGQAMERGDLIRAIADASPRSDGERQILYHKAVGQALAMSCAKGAMTAGTPPPTVALLAGSFLKLSRFSLDLDDKFSAGRAERVQAPREVVGHFHVHTAAHLPTTGLAAPGRLAAASPTPSTLDTAFGQGEAEGSPRDFNSVEPAPPAKNSRSRKGRA